jgi:hypothetical protein
MHESYPKAGEIPTVSQKTQDGYKIPVTALSYPFALGPGQEQRFKNNGW